jgi:hypothetical protein
MKFERNEMEIPLPDISPPERKQAAREVKGILTGGLIFYDIRRKSGHSEDRHRLTAQKRLHLSNPGEDTVESSPIFL